MSEVLFSVCGRAGAATRGYEAGSGFSGAAFVASYRDDGGEGEQVQGSETISRRGSSRNQSTLELRFLTGDGYRKNSHINS